MKYVLDTSVILSDPHALERLGDRDIVIPLVVLTELESKRTHPDLGYAARTALRYLEQLRKEHGSLSSPIHGSGGGTIRVELNHVETSKLPQSFRTSENDNRILAVASNLAAEGEQVTLMTKDPPLRLKASVVGLEACDYDTAEIETDWSGIIRIEVEMEDILSLYEFGSIYIEETDSYPINTGVLVTSGTKTALGKIGQGGDVRLANYTTTYEKLLPKNAEQSIAIDLLSDPQIGIVSIGGLAGSGKTVLSLASGLAAVKSKQYNRVIVFRPVYSVGGQDLGFLPGTAEEKMAPWSSAVYDAMESFMKANEVEDAKRSRQIEVLPLTHIRGRTISNAYIIIDEAQNLDLMTLVTAMSRVGEGSKIVLTHDVNQRDNLRVGKHDGIARVISTLADSPLFAHITLNKSERSKVAELVASSFDL